MTPRAASPREKWRMTGRASNPLVGFNTVGCFSGEGGVRGVTFRSILIRRGGVFSRQKSSSVEAMFCLLELGGEDAPVSER